jgi:GxxExxY protein
VRNQLSLISFIPKIPKITGQSSKSICQGAGVFAFLPKAPFSRTFQSVSAGREGGQTMTINDPLTEQIIGYCYRVANELGYGFLEKVYENALAHELRKAKVDFVQQKGIEVFYDGVNVGNYLADLIVEGRVLVELKSALAIEDAHVAQCLHYLKATNLETCLLINFAKSKVEIRRFVMSGRTGSGEMEVDVKDIL